MDFSVSSEQLAWRTHVREFVRAQVLPRTDLDRCNCFPWDLYRAAFDAKLITAPLPSALGGGGKSLFEMLLAAEELGYGDLGVATSTLLLTLAAGPLLLFGSPAQRERWIRPLTEQLRFASFAWTEPAGSSMLHGRPAATTARPVPGGYVLNGVKSTISNASVASLFTVFARIEPGPVGLSCFVVPSDAPGVVTRAPYEKMGQRAGDTGELELREVFVAEDQLLGRPGQGQQIAVRSLCRSRVGICAMAVGVCRRARDLVIEYGHARTAGDGRALIEQQDYRLRIAQMEAEIETLRSLAWRAGWEVEHGDEGIKLASSAKLMGGSLAARITGEAVEMLGASGYLATGTAEKLMRDAKVLQIYEGAEAIQRMLIADTATRRSRVGG